MKHFPRVFRAMFAVALLAGGIASAQTWPSKPVTVVVPWPAGGPSDTAARPLAKKLSEALGQTFIIDNRAGAGGNIGSAQVAKSTPDGHTLLVTSSAPIVINPSLYRNMPFDPAKDLAPITNLLRVPLVLVVHPSVGARTVKDLLALIQSRPGGMTYASSGNGTPQHLTAELFKTHTKANLTHVPYKGSAPAIADLIGGHVPMMFDSTVAIMAHIKSGKAVPIAITSARRSPLLPAVPTFAESSLPALESYAWYGLFAPAGVPKATLMRINAEALKAMQQPEFQKVLADTGSDYVGDTSEHFAAFVAAEAIKWTAVVKESGATAD